jgi:hypothetical protein
MTRSGATQDPAEESWRDETRAAQLLATEHWSLLSARSLAWTEVFSRSALYLNVLSASVVALALVAQATDFQGPFVVFTIVLLCVVYFIGATTVVRLSQSAIEDLTWVAGMNRIRAAYVHLEPRMAQHLITSPHDDERGVLVSSGVPAGSGLSLAHLFVTAPGMLAVVNSVVAGAILAIVAAYGLGAGAALVTAAGVVGFAASLGLLLRQYGRAFAVLRAYQPRFPTP